MRRQAYSRQQICRAVLATADPPFGYRGQSDGTYCVIATRSHTRLVARGWRAERLSGDPLRHDHPPRV
jgi:hypothetical protein